MIKNGDCLNRNNYPDEKVDLILTDPPFYSPQPYKQIRENNERELKPIFVWDADEYVEKWGQFLDNIVDLIKPTGWFIFKSDDLTSKIVFNETIKRFDYYGDIIWDKVAIGLGHFIRKQHEILCLYRPKNASKTFFLRPNSKSQLKSISHGNSKGKAFSSIIKIPMIKNGTFGSEIQHINQTPVELWVRLIRYFSPEGALILDPFAGSGSVGVAAYLLKRRYWGIEIDKDFYKLAEENLRKFQKNKHLTSFF